MKIETFAFRSDRGWSVNAFPKLDSNQTLVLVFGSPAFAANREPLEQLRSAYPKSHIVGCSTSGEILGTAIFDASLAVAVVRFEHATVQTASTSVDGPGESFWAGRQLGRMLPKANLRHVLVFSDGLVVNGSALIRGLNFSLPPSVRATGGLAGDGTAFKSTWVLEGGIPKSRTVCVVGLYGDRIHVGLSSQGGWDIFGPERSVTRSEENVLYELDGRPALELYKTYLGERANELPAAAFLFPLAIRPDPADSKQLVRTILGIDEKAQSLTFAGNVPEGARAQLMRGNIERLVQAGAKAASSIQTQPQLPVLAVAVSCVGRRIVLRDRTEEETEAAMDHLPRGSSMVGFYSYGELSPSGTEASDLHNQTFTLTTFSES